MDELNKLSYRIIGCAMNVHQDLGPGLLESSYLECLKFELLQAGIFVEKEKPLPLFYKEIKMDIGYRADLFVEKSIIVEVKCVEGLHDIHVAQVLTYLKLSKAKLGLLINFNSLLLKDGVRRIIR